MSVQTSYLVDAVKGTAGQLVDSGNCEKISRTCDQTTLGFGLFVARRNTQSDTPEECGAPTATADVTSRGYGVSVKDELAKPGGYSQYEEVRILRKGRIFVDAEEAWTDGAQPFVRFASGAGGTVLGSFRSSADTATAVALPGARYVGTGSAAGLAVVELNLPTN